MKRSAEKSIGSRDNKIRKRAKKQATNGKQEPLQTFSKLKVNQVDVAVGDSVQVAEWSGHEAFARVNTIFKDPASGDPMVNLTWYYTPKDLFEEVHEFFGTAELMTSDHTQDTGVHWIQEKIQVLPFDEYYAKFEVDSDVFYTRAHFEHDTNKIMPDFEEWKRTCVCNSIINPDTQYLICEGCSGLFHQECVEGDPEEFALCINCADKENGY